MKAILHMRPRLIGIIAALALLMLCDIAEAQYGTAHRATRRRTAVVVASATHAKDEQAQQQEDAAEQQAAAQQAEADRKADSAKQADAARAEEAAQGDHLPYGTIVSKLPEGCVPITVGETQYYHCGNDYYRVAYQENNLVYVTIEDPV